MRPLARLGKRAKIAVSETVVNAARFERTLAARFVTQQLGLLERGWIEDFSIGATSHSDNVDTAILGLVKLHAPEAQRVRLANMARAGGFFVSRGESLCTSPVSEKQMKQSQIHRL